jgi:hypothetical protein
MAATSAAMTLSLSRCSRTTSQRSKSPSGHDEKPKQSLAEKKESSYSVPDDQKESRNDPGRRHKSGEGRVETAARDETRACFARPQVHRELAAGATIEEIAASEGISIKWARERKAALLASRVIDTPHEFIKLQIRRLSEAMLVSYSAMSLGDLNRGRQGDQGCPRARPLSRVRPAPKRAEVCGVFVRRVAPGARFAGAPEAGDGLGCERGS